MFNAETPINITVRHEGKRTQVTVRWPTDEEWAAYRRKKPTNVRILSRGRTEADPESIEPDAQLYQLIQQNGAPSLTPAEAKAVIDGIAQIQVLGVSLGDDNVSIELDTIHGRVEHVLKVPTMDQIREFQLTSHVTSQPNQRFQVRHSIENAARLWDKCKLQCEGYEGDVPILHKDTAIRNVIQAIEQEMLPPERDEGF